MSDLQDDEVKLTANANGSFPVTQWSLVQRAGANTDTQARGALESLCRHYWYPLYAYARRHGRDHHQAEDSTQEFLAHLLADEGLQRARPERGRFRTFLLSGLRNFLTSEWRQTQTARRGGGFAPLPLGEPGPNDQRRLEAVDPGLSPEQIFDRTWALGVVDRAVYDLRAEYATSGRAKIFEALAPLIWGNENADALAQHAAATGLTVNSFTVALHRARRRLGDRLRAVVAETVADPSEIDAELRHLVSAIGARGSA